MFNIKNSLGKNKYLGLDIGKTVTKVVITQKNKEKVIIENVKVYPTPDTVYTHKGTFNPVELKKFILNICQKHQASRIPIVLSTPQKNTTIKFMEIKEKDLSQIEDWINQEIGKKFLDIPEKQALDYAIIPFDDTESKTQAVKLLVVSVPQKNVDLIEEVFSGCSLSALDTEILACQRVFEKYLRKEHRHKRILCIDYGYTSTRIMLFKGFLPKNYFLVESGVKHLEDAMSMDKNFLFHGFSVDQSLFSQHIDAKDSDSLPWDNKSSTENSQSYNPFSVFKSVEDNNAQVRDYSNEKPDSTDESLITILRDWMEQVESVVRELERSGEKVDAISFIGGGRNISNLPETLSSMLNIPVERMENILDEDILRRGNVGNTSQDKEVKKILDNDLGGVIIALGNGIYASS